MSSDNGTIPRIDIGPLFDGAGTARDATDRAIMAAAGHSGFMTVHGLPERIPLSAPRRQAMLEIFHLHDEELRPLWRHKFDPAQGNLYRGWFPAQAGALSYKRGIDMGPDVARGRDAAVYDDPLLEPTPMPTGKRFEEWREVVAAYYRGMEETGRALMRALARGMRQDEHVFDAAFEDGISTLRLIEYPPRPAEAFEGLAHNDLWVDHDGERFQVIGKAHVDSGLVTLLAQDGVSGLQARSPSGGWCDVPPTENTLAVNFGKLLERWTNGRVRATEHRVLGSGRQRHSIPFFYEPHVDAEIAPLPGNPAFTPFQYGDHLWQSVTQFVEFQGMEGFRLPHGENANT